MKKKEFSEDIYCNEAETKFFSEGEEFTEYMVRLFSEEDGHCPVEKAIETGKKVETDKRNHYSNFSYRSNYRR